ncbi:hypothetical protein LPTSP3_g03890 [Leptospira kobayashii]|uniref:Uncharacterized protein n=2 Tax=Leptospira kobayashii TaxID=1917830 RepID=A0ABN6KCS9_9LEPT|nr:hypothetical protein LPTSP3_g03890 [Leptospira kobayashii]
MIAVVLVRNPNFNLYMKQPNNIILADSISAFIGGIVTLALSSLLSEWYHLSSALILFIGFVNILYGCYSGFISFRLLSGNYIKNEFVIILIIANSLWAGHCFTQVWYLQDISSIFGLLHLGLEGLYVIGLAYLEVKFLLSILNPKKP